MWDSKEFYTSPVFFASDTRILVFCLEKSPGGNFGITFLKKLAAVCLSAANSYSPGLLILARGVISIRKPYRGLSVEIAEFTPHIMEIDYYEGVI